MSKSPQKRTQVRSTRRNSSFHQFDPNGAFAWERRQAKRLTDLEAAPARLEARHAKRIVDEELRRFYGGRSDE